MPPKPTSSAKPHPLAIYDAIPDDIALMAVLERTRAALIEGGEHLSATAGYIHGLITRFDRGEGRSGFGRNGRVRRTSGPLFVASDLLIDAAAEIKRSAFGFNEVYVNNAPLPGEFKVRSRNRT